ncbi:MAG: hypothetical protein B7Y36_16335 [Novosphingobium sp. 28-62-57]|nr:MAG: hypothetical protein B7Z36_00310 [Novosphingobium sp. 12-63-9]OYZ08570.1 MAG: hypothetical protein B7Y36_16335 [Novosphingobium sp. 28-62-57]OZA30590.1 MAG: hypothetical protein B7X92_15840 [Novosphingobium sp. 17-62-9]
MEHLPTAIVDHMHRTRPALTDEALQDRFGISYNTWRRIVADKPLRRSVAQRLISRIGAELAER